MLHRVKFEDPGAKFPTRRFRHKGVWLRAERGEPGHRCREMWVDATGIEDARNQAIAKYPDGKIESVTVGLAPQSRAWMQNDEEEINWSDLLTR